MPCRVRSTSILRRRHKPLPSSRRQVRLLMRLCRRVASGCTSSPALPSEGSDGQGSR